LLITLYFKQCLVHHQLPQRILLWRVVVVVGGILAAAVVRVDYLPELQV
jgi:hypothetical protein